MRAFIRLVALVTLLAPTSSQAQVDRVGVSARDLIAAAAEPDSTRDERIGKAAAAFRQALTDWTGPSNRSKSRRNASCRPLPPTAPGGCTWTSGSPTATAGDSLMPSRSSTRRRGSAPASQTSNCYGRGRSKQMDKPQPRPMPF